MGETAIHKWPWPEPNNVADAPKAIRDLGLAIEATLITPNSWKTYTPTWASETGTQPFNPSQRIGRYRAQNGWCDVYVYLAFSSTTNGGTGRLNVSLPLAATAEVGEQPLGCKTWSGSDIRSWNGVAYISGGSAVARPMFCISDGSTVHAPWQSCDLTVAPGTGVPLIAGQYSVRANGSFTLFGRYKVA